ncbi:AMP-binding protein [Sulfidibacter corallicola]
MENLPILISRTTAHLRRMGLEKPHHPAIVDGTSIVDYRRLDQMAAAYAASLQKNGLQFGDRVCLFLDKSVALVAALYGTWLAGGVAVPLFPELRDAQVTHIGHDSGCQFFVTEPRRLARLKPESIHGHVLLVPEQLEAAPSHFDEPPQIEGGDPAIVLYTSGSTGKPKGICLSHDNLEAGTRIVARYLELSSEERILSVLPFNFDYGLNQLLTSVYRGATLVLERTGLPAEICRTLIAHRITGLAGVPPLWLQLVGRFSPFRTMDFPHLRYLTNTGGAFPVSVLDQIRQRLPHTRIFLMYGLTEAFRSSYLPPEELDLRPTSMGIAIPETRLEVLAPQGDACGPDEIGELVHSGPTVAMGYWNNPRATAATFRPDPFSDRAGTRMVHSGDRVRRDAAGYFTFVGRGDKMLKINGFRLNPEEVEEIAYASGLAHEAIAKPQTERDGSVRLVLHVVPRDPEAFQPRDLLAYCKGHMPRYMVPAKLQVHASFPRTATGKIAREQVHP